MIVTGPTIVFGAHGPVAASPPTSTRPVLPVIVSGPVIVAPQLRTTPAPFAVIGPLTVPPSMSSDPPALTDDRAARDAACADADRLAGLDGQRRRNAARSMHGLESLTVSTPGTNVENV